MPQVNTCTPHKVSGLHRALLQIFGCAVLAAAVPARAAEITLMTYNIHAGIPAGKSSKDYIVTRQDMRNIADVITSAGADIVALQEVHCEWDFLKLQPRTSALNEPRLLAGYTSMNYFFGGTLDDTRTTETEAGHLPNTDYTEMGTSDYWLTNGGRHAEFGNAVLSRRTMTVKHESIALPGPKQKEQRGYIRANLPGDSKLPEITVYATHLQHDSAEAREIQIKALLEAAAAETSGTVVFLMGDFNQRPEVPGFNIIAEAKRRGFHDLHEQFAKSQGMEADLTIPADKPDRRIDYILCNRPLEVLDAHVPAVLTSDHRPVVVRVNLPRR